MTTEPSDVVVRELTKEDAPSLAQFSCRAFREPWTDVIEEMIRDKLADELESGTVSALGLWSGDELCGVAAWIIEPDTPKLCRSVLLAIRNGSRRSGFGRRLKEAVLAEARKAGASAVVSTVHWDNDAMIELNVAVGANVERIPGDHDYCRCIIAL